MKLAIIGATGVVGNTFINILEQDLHIFIDQLYLLSSSRSAGKKIMFKGKEHTILELTETFFEENKIDYALFCAGGKISLKYAPIAAKNNCIVIDNSSAWRMESGVPLIVPEVNIDAANGHKGIIANPNCAAIQGVVALKPLHDAYTLKRVVYSTYQAVSGAGQGALDDLRDGINGAAPKTFAHPIAFNLIPQIDLFDNETGYTKEELKIIEETQKILGLNALKMTATAVRVPVINGHSISANIEFEKSFTLEEVRDVLAKAPGLVLQDDISDSLYPMPLACSGKDEVFVGRIRRDPSVENGLNIFIVADNLKKGAALNAVQILKQIM